MALDTGRLEQLRAIPIFAQLDDRLLERVGALAAELDVPAEHVLIQPGQPGTGLFFVQEGSVVVDVPGSPIMLGPGEFVGELSLLVEDEPRSVRVRAAERTRCLALSRNDFDELLRAEPAIAVSMLRVVAGRLLDTTRTLGRRV
jgi:CRP-like cAMP-binding protein